MSHNIVAGITNVNLDEEAAIITRECAAADATGHRRIEHAIEAGIHFVIVRDCIGRGLRAWLQKHGFRKTSCYDYMLLAENAESVRSSGHFSIVAALRMLRKKSGKPTKSSKPRSKSGSSKSDGSPLSKASWTKATVEERRRFLDGIGANSLCEALSFAFRSELKRRIAGQQTAATSSLNETIAAGIRQALSLQKIAKPKDTPAMGVASALNAINNKLTAAGFDLNNLTSVVIDPAATQKKAA
jgi:hypothetical protein